MKKGNSEDGLVYHAGFPNAGEDRHGVSLNLDALVVKHRSSTYFWRLAAAIPELHWPAETIVVVDRALPARVGRVVVAIIEEEFTLCRVAKRGLMMLDASLVGGDAALWGVVTYVVQPVAE